MLIKGKFMKSENNKFILYVMNDCPFCTEAKELLKQNNLSHDVICFDNRPKVLEEFKDIYNWQTVPMVFERLEDNNFKLIGGYTDLKKRLGGA